MMEGQSLKQVFEKKIPQEDQHTEFKRSIFVDASGQCGYVQMQKIARTLAGFMNAKGGELYIGISDARHAVGMEKDLELLAAKGNRLDVCTVRYCDAGATYRADEDSYGRKIRAIVKGYLGPEAAGLVGDIKIREFNGALVCQVRVNPCRKGRFVYLYRWERKGMQDVEYTEICVRRGNETETLRGAQRDRFVQEHTLEQLRAWQLPGGASGMEELAMFAAA